MLYDYGVLELAPKGCKGYSGVRNSGIFRLAVKETSMYFTFVHFGPLTNVSTVCCISKTWYKLGLRFSPLPKYVEWMCILADDDMSARCLEEQFQV